MARLRWLSLALAMAVACALAGCDDSSSEGARQDELTVEMGAFEVPPGSEVLMCQLIAPTWPTTWLGSVSSKGTKAMHHIRVFRIDGVTEGTAPHPCVDQDPENAGELPGAKNTTFELPPGVGFQLSERQGLYLQAHFLNTTSSPLHPRVRWGGVKMAEADVVTSAGVTNLANKRIDVPPHGTGSATKTCTFSSDTSMFHLIGHFHDHGTRFEAEVAGRRVFEHGAGDDTGTWFAAPYVQIHRGDEVKWTCDFMNDGDESIAYGASIQRDEMCNYYSLVFPPLDGATRHCE